MSCPRDFDISRQHKRYRFKNFNIWADRQTFVSHEKHSPNKANISAKSFLNPPINACLSWGVQKTKLPFLPLTSVWPLPLWYWPDFLASHTVHCRRTLILCHVISRSIHTSPSNCLDKTKEHVFDLWSLSVTLTYIVHIWSLLPDILSIAEEHLCLVISKSKHAGLR